MRNAPDAPTIKSRRELEAMREAGRVVMRARNAVAAAARPGVRTRELEEIAREVIAAEGATPSFLGYMGYPAVICVSIDNEIVHGIPGERVVREGELVSLDVGAVVDGFHGDSAVTVIAGVPPPGGEALVEAARRALELGIRAAQPGNRVGDISAAVEGCVRPLGYELVREYVGHGIGRRLHEAPQVPNFGPPNQGPRLRPGMTLAIEPMVNIGGWNTRTLEDGWTVVTADGSLSAHFEHTVAITEDGPEVLTGAGEAARGPCNKTQDRGDRRI